MSKLSFEDKINLYEDKLNGLSYKSLSIKYKIRDNRVKYLVRLIEIHGYDILRKYKNNDYPKYIKEDAINSVLVNKESIYSVALRLGLSSNGNSMDNGMMENFFGIMFYDQEDKYETLDDLIKAIDDYIHYYNYDRIKTKLKGLSPVNYRLQSSD